MLSPSLQCGRFLLEVADVFVVDVKIDEGAQFAVIGVEMLLQVGMLGDEGEFRASPLSRP